MCFLYIIKHCCSYNEEDQCEATLNTMSYLGVIFNYLCTQKIRLILLQAD